MISKLKHEKLGIRLDTRRKHSSRQTFDICIIDFGKIFSIAEASIIEYEWECVSELDGRVERRCSN
jgi:hypothetical protein